MGRRQAQDDPSRGWQDTHPGTHKARSSSFTRNTLENKNVWKSETACPRPQSIPSTVAATAQTVGGRAGNQAWDTPRPSGALRAPVPLVPGCQLNKFKELHTHLVTLFSAFTWGTGRARKSLEVKVTWISKELSLLLQPPGRHSTGQTVRRWQ